MMLQFFTCSRKLILILLNMFAKEQYINKNYPNNYKLIENFGNGKINLRFKNLVFG